MLQRDSMSPHQEQNRPIRDHSNPIRLNLARPCDGTRVRLDMIRGRLHVRHAPGSCLRTVNPIGKRILG